MASTRAHEVAIGWFSASYIQIAKHRRMTSRSAAVAVFQQ